MPDRPDSLESRTLRQRVGGRWAISWQAYVITAILGLLSLLVGEQHAAESARDFGWWLVAFTVAMGAAGMLVLAANYSVFRHRRERPMPVSSVVVLNGLCGALYSLIIGVGAGRLGLQTDITIVERATINALIAMWWGPTLSYFLDYRQQFTAVRRAVLAQAVAVELAQAQQQELARRMREELMEEVNAELIPARDAVDSMLQALSHVGDSPSGEPAVDVRFAADFLRGTATQSVRPLSRRIWRQAEGKRARERWWALPANIVRHQPFRPLAFAAVDVLGTLAQQARVFGLVSALALLASGLVVTVALMLAGNGLMRRHPHRHAVIFLATLVSLQATVVLRADLRERLVPGSAPPSWIVTQVLATVVVVLVTSGFGAWRDKESEILSNLRSELEHDQVVALARSRQMAELARELAQVLHGAVQSRLLACAMALDADDGQHGDTALNAALAQALDVLTDPLQPRERTGSLVDEVHRKVALWEGFCDFEVRISPEAAVSGGAEPAGRIVEEAITNALRHGHATQIAIGIDMTGDGHVRIVIRDNGVGVQPGTPGLGSAYLQQATAGRWSLAPVSGGARLEALVTPGAA